MNAWNLILEAGLIVKFVMTLLLLGSIYSWSIILSKVKRVRVAKKINTQFLDTFWNSKSLDEVQEKIKPLLASPIAVVFDSGYHELKKLPIQDRTQDGAPEINNIERALKRSAANEIESLEKSVDWLATSASAAPFVGLFGTVWGIMTSFQNIGAMGSASLAVVAPGISEALIATALGLAVAIPAAVGYNYLVARIKKISTDIDSFSQDFLNLVQRSLLSTRKKHHKPESLPTSTEAGA